MLLLSQLGFGSLTIYDPFVILGASFKFLRHPSLSLDISFFTEKIVKEQKQVHFIPDIICRREEGGLSEQQWENNRKEIKHYLQEYQHHKYL